MDQKKSSERAEAYKGRGGPRQIDPSIMLGQADHYHLALPKLGPRILAAESTDEIARAFNENAACLRESLLQFSALISEIIRDPKLRINIQITDASAVTSDFNFPEHSQASLRDSGLSIEDMNFETAIAKFDLAAEVWEYPEFHRRFEYNTFI